MSEKKLLASYRVADSKVLVSTGYHAGIVATARSWGGKFDRTTNEWAFPLSRLPEIEAKIGANLDDLVEVQVDASNLEGYAAIKIGWHVLASRRGRDYRAECFADLVAGSLPSSGGSVKNPEVNPSDDAVFQFWCPRDFADRCKELTIVTDPKTSDAVPTIDYDDYDALIAERDYLLCRVAEIDAILNAVPPEVC